MNYTDPKCTKSLDWGKLNIMLYFRKANFKTFREN